VYLADLACCDCRLRLRSGRRRQPPPDHPTILSALAADVEPVKSPLPG